MLLLALLSGGSLVRPASASSMRMANKHAPNNEAGDSAAAETDGPLLVGADLLGDQLQQFGAEGFEAVGGRKMLQKRPKKSDPTASSPPPVTSTSAQPPPPTTLMTR